jgi:hypothetical protein
MPHAVYATGWIFALVTGCAGMIYASRTHAFQDRAIIRSARLSHYRAAYMTLGSTATSVTLLLIQRQATVVAGLALLLVGISFLMIIQSLYRFRNGW